MAPLPLYATSVAAEWVDYNGHMNDACYGIPFSRATDGLMDRIGLDAAARAETRHTIYTLAAMTRFLQEARLGDGLAVSGQILEHDAKKLVVFMEMRRSTDGSLLATSEQLLLCVDQGGPEPKAAPFPPAVLAALAELAAAHAELPRPAGAGRGIALKR